MPTKPGDKRTGEGQPAHDQPAKAEAGKPTLFTTVAVQLLATHFTGVQKRSEKKQTSWVGSVGSAFGLYDQNLAAAKRWVVQMHLIGKLVGTRGVREPDDHQKYLPMLNSMEYTDSRDRNAHKLTLSERNGLLAFSARDTDDVSKAALLDEVHLLNCLLGATIDKIHKSAGPGSSAAAIEKANAIINTLHTYCNKIGLLDAAYDTSDPAMLLFHAGLLYIGDRCQETGTVAQAKIDRLVTMLKGLIEQIDERRILDGVKYQKRHLGETPPVQRVGYDIVLDTIKALKDANIEICEDNAWKVSVPLSVSMFMPSVSIPLGITPSTGKFAELMDFATAAVKEQRGLKPEHGLYQEGGELYQQTSHQQAHFASAMS